MAERPSLAGLSLKTKPSGAIQDDDPGMDKKTMPNKANFNTLILFGARTANDRERRVDLFNFMMKFILESRLLMPDPGNVQLFMPDRSEGSARPWEEWVRRYADLRPSSELIAAEGRNNVAYRVPTRGLALNRGHIPNRTLQILTNNAKYLVVRRRSRTFDSNMKMERVLTELAMQARMSELGIGPKMYLAWCTPNSTLFFGRKGPRSNRSAEAVDMHANDVILDVCTLNEAFDGNLDSILEGRYSGSVLPNDATHQDQQHGFWRAVGNCIVRGVKHGILHFDLKGANMLYMRVEGPQGMSDYEYKVCYTESDPKYFMIEDSESREFKRMRLCFGLLSLYQLLASHRCFHQKLKFPFEAVEKIARRALIEAYVAAHESRVTVKDIESLCDSGGPSTSHDSPEDLPQRLEYLLRRWFTQYLVRDPEKRCIDELARNIPFREIADIIVKFAESGTIPSAGANQRT
tara:strand:- start:1525 stop:2913 length:1389 start_codon:yes stop_codon:yes gene_type:complete